MKKILYIVLGVLIAVPTFTFAVSVSVPSATSVGQTLVGLVTGNYQATSTLIVSSNKNVGVATTSPAAKFAIQANNGDTNKLLFLIGSSTQSSTTTLLSVSNTGTTTLSGDINFATSTSGFYSGGVRVMKFGNPAVFWNTATAPLFIGYNAGAAFPISSFLNDFGSIGIGSKALESLNTLGTETVAFGALSGQFLTSGALSTFVGMHSGGATNGTGSTFIGNDSCRDCIDVIGYSTALGQGSLAHGVPANATAIGSQAMKGNSQSIILSGSLTNGDVVSVTLTASGGTPAIVSAFLPITKSHTVTGGDTLTTIASDIATQINNTNIIGTSYQLTATAEALPDGTVALWFVWPGNPTNGWAITVTTGVTGSATEVLTLQGGATFNQSVGVGNWALAGPGANNAVLSLTAVGDSAGRYVTSSQYSTFIGRSSGGSVTSGSTNTFVGALSGQSITTASDNVAVGFWALSSDINQGNNTAIGARAGRFTTGASNILVGQNAGGTTLTTGASNIIIGTGSDAPTSGTSNFLDIGDVIYGRSLYGAGKIGIGTSTPTNTFGVAGYVDVDGKLGGYKFDGSKFIYASSTNGATVMGIGAGTNLDATSTVSQNTAIGYQALTTTPVNGTLGQNTAVGYKSMANLTSGTGNIGIGASVMNNGAITGNYNIGIGTGAISALTSGTTNVAIGANALGSVNSGSSNIAIGDAISSQGGAAALSNLTAIGYHAGLRVTGNDNIIFGSNSGTSLTSGLRNVIIGTAAATTLTGGGNIILGAYVEPLAAANNAQLNIGNTVYGTGIYNTAVVSSAPVLNSLVGISSTTPFAKFSIHANNGDTNTTLFAVGSSTASATSTIFTIKNDGTIFAPLTTSSGSAQTGYWCYDANGQLIRDTVTCTVSALKFKKDIKPTTLGLAEVLKMQPVTYYNKDSSFGDKQQVGFIADWSEKVLPLLIVRDSSGDVHGFNYEQYTAVLTGAIQDLNLKIENIKVGKVVRSAEENWQWFAIIILALGLLYQQTLLWSIKSSMYNR